jgi:hypothetical protein
VQARATAANQTVLYRMREKAAGALLQRRRKCGAALLCVRKGFASVAHGDDKVLAAVSGK